jgi:hypothetical protein
MFPVTPLTTRMSAWRFVNQTSSSLRSGQPKSQVASRTFFTQRGFRPRSGMGGLLSFGALLGVISGIHTKCLTVAVLSRFAHISFYQHGRCVHFQRRCETGLHDRREERSRTIGIRCRKAVEQKLPTNFDSTIDRGRIQGAKSTCYRKCCECVFSTTLCILFNTVI